MRFALIAMLVVFSTSAAFAEPAPLPAATAEKLPRWRGFNLLEKFQLGNGRKPFVEQDFALISRLGFNFVRLPMDYRFWIKDGDWESFDESTLKEIDQAVEWGKKYGIHVCINFHRAPGYTVAQPPERLDLWKDPEAQRVCALHWRTFARRYKDIPNDRLSFNLFNEPAKIEVGLFVPVIKKMVEAIRAEDPNRLIISDGLEWGQKPVTELAGLHVAQATRGYAPSRLSHYKANWIKGNEDWPTPKWPAPQPLPSTLVAPQKPEGVTQIVIDGPFTTQTQLRLHVMRVSNAADLLVEADTQKIFEKSLKSGPGEGEWKKVEFVEKYKVYQNVFDRDYVATIPPATTQAKIRVTAGDWLTLSEIGLRPAGAQREDTVACEAAYGKKPDPFRYDPASASPFTGLPTQDRDWLWKNHIQPWKDLEAKGLGVFVGEWGSFNRTPHDVFLRWAEDNLANWKKADMGWAMWNFRGAFGVLDSGRTDVKYETFEGHKLDRKLLELLQRY
jgi:hypothetical protein